MFNCYFIKDLFAFPSFNLQVFSPIHTSEYKSEPVYGNKTEKSIQFPLAQIGVVAEMEWPQI